jgi:hypothetical protein
MKAGISSFSKSRLSDSVCNSSLVINGLISAETAKKMEFYQHQQVHDVYSMLGLSLPKPERSNRSLGLIRNSYILNKQMIIDNS